MGFVVSKAVGGSVVRHAVARRLRAPGRARGWPRCRRGSRVVVRALPAAADRDLDQLAVDLDAALERPLRMTTVTAPHGGGDAVRRWPCGAPLLAPPWAGSSGCC